jgi:hypothetical protein
MTQMIWRTYDLLFGYRHNKPQTERQWLRRLIIIESMGDCTPGERRVVLGGSVRAGPSLPTPGTSCSGA